FALRSVNLTKIESKMRRGRPGHYDFYVDFEGHRRDKAPGLALKAIRAKTTFLKILGSYPKASE
ncbi:MAG: bifunctional chorismate mutase/prephenate dehydratase, partial [Nitrososphaerota archaeon]